MRLVKFSKDLKVTILKEGVICLIDIDNPSWNWMSKYLNGKTTIQVPRIDLLNANESFFRELIDKTYRENKDFILEAKMGNFNAY